MAIGSFLSSPPHSSLSPLSQPPSAPAPVVDKYEDPLFLSNSDHTNLQLSSSLFDGSGFLIWKREVTMALIAKNKHDFIAGTISSPGNTNTRHNQFVRCDLTVLKWLQNSCEKQIRDSFSYVHTAREFWIEINEVYNESNALELYELRKSLMAISQANSGVMEYYNALKCSWETIDSIDPIPHYECGAMDLCSCKLLKRLLDRDTQSKSFQMLMGLNSAFDTVKTNILSIEPLPSLNKALCLLQKVEKQKKISDAADVLHEANAFAVQKHSIHPNKKYKQSKEYNDKVCFYCGRHGHTREECFKLKTCEFCKVKGHIIKHCFKKKAFDARGEGTSGNVAVAQACHGDTANGYDAAVKLSLLDTSGVPPALVDSVVQQVLKAFSANPNFSPASFAGPYQ